MIYLLIRDYFHIKHQYYSPFKHQKITTFMKFTIQTILSLPIDGASSHLLIINNKIKILLDCGISHTFDFSKYSKKAVELKTVSLVLISHSSLQYSGALAFLVDELGLNPKIFYTTQPIMRYSPLNLHEQMLILRSSNYRKDVFNKIYRIYESINIVKTEQKKSVDVGQKTNVIPTNNSLTQTNQAMEAQQPESTIGQVDKIIYFTCYPGGGGMGSISWRISFGIVNILYLVQYNNYSLYHINGLDFNQLKQPIDVMITDACQQVQDSKMKKQVIYERIKQILVTFYEQNNLNIAKPMPITTQESQPKLLITCYPNQLLIQLMAVMKKVIEQLQPPENREKIKVIHLSSRFLQLVKSQIDSFSNQFKQSLQNIEQYFIHAKSLNSRINLATIHSLQGLLNDGIGSSVKICHLGPTIREEGMKVAKQEGLRNINNFKLMQLEQQNQNILSSAKIIEEMQDMQDEKLQNQMEEQESKDKSSSQNFNTQGLQDLENMDQLIKQQNQENNKLVRGNYFRKIVFPYFVKSCREQPHSFDEFGMRHEYARFQQRKTIEEYNIEDQLPNLSMQKKHSMIQVMNIDFKIADEQKYRPINYRSLTYLGFVPQKTNFNSSIQLVLQLKPANIVMINSRNDQNIFRKYQSVLGGSQLKQNKLINLAIKTYHHMMINNQLISYKLNYIPIPNDLKLQKVKGKITKANGVITIHLECLQGKEHLDFRLDKFFKQVKNENYNCVFTKDGLIIQGVRIYRQKKRIILQGNYSDQYFKIRKLLYDFLDIQP